MEKVHFEKYFLDSNTPFTEKKKLILVIYDITDNKRRTKFVKFLEGYGKRVQKSAFEMILDEHRYNNVITQIPSKITAEDNVRVYKLPISGEVTAWGSRLSESEEVIII